MAEFFERIGVRRLLARALPDQRTSPNLVNVVDTTMALLLNVLVGGQRFAHVESLRCDKVLRSLFGFERMPAATTVTRYFGGFRRQQVERLWEHLSSFVFGLIDCPKEGDIIDIDSTVFTRYGQQEGSAIGYNPHRRGRQSHHPVLAMLAHSRTIIHCWLRSGNALPMRGCAELIGELLSKIPPDFKLRALRADSGFYTDEFLSVLEEYGLGYTVAVRLRQDIKVLIRGITSWEVGRDGREYGEFIHQPTPRHTRRRIVVVRARINERKAGKRLLEMPQYTFTAVVTNLDMTADEAMTFYNGRADSENRIKELKDDFAAGGFCLRSFDGTEAAFRLICFLFNLTAVFKHRVLAERTKRMATVRAQTFVAGASLGRAGRAKVLRVGLTDAPRSRFERLVTAVSNVALPTASQLIEALNACSIEATPWTRRRRSTHRLVVFGTG